MGLDGYMNKSYGAMMEGGKQADKQNEGGAAKHEEHKRAGQQRIPHVHAHPHHDEHGRHTGTTVHTLHHDGTHTKQDFGPGDHQAVGEHVAAQMSGGHEANESPEFEAGEQEGAAEHAFGER